MSVSVLLLVLRSQLPPVQEMRKPAAGRGWADEGVERRMAGPSPSAPAWLWGSMADPWELKLLSFPDLASEPFPDPTAFSHFRFLSSRWGLPLGNEGVHGVHLCFHTSPHPLHLFTDPLLVDLMPGTVLCTT